MRGATNGALDLGGTGGMGEVSVPEIEPVFREGWDKAVF